MLLRMEEHTPAMATGSYPVWPGQSLLVARCDDAGQWTYQRATVEYCGSDFMMLRFQAGYRECFDWHAFTHELGVRIGPAEPVEKI